MDQFNDTMRFQLENAVSMNAHDILMSVYGSLKEKGYDPINQIVGDLLSGDPTYITIHNGARPMPAASTGQNILVKSSQPTRSGFQMDQVKSQGRDPSKDLCPGSFHSLINRVFSCIKRSSVSR